MTDWLTDWQSYCLSCCSIWHEQARLEKWKLILGSKLHTQNFISFLLKVKIIYSDQMWLVKRRKKSGAQQKINSKCNKETRNINWTIKFEVWTNQEDNKHIKTIKPSPVSSGHPPYVCSTLSSRLDIRRVGKVPRCYNLNPSLYSLN